MNLTKLGLASVITMMSLSAINANADMNMKDKATKSTLDGYTQVRFEDDSKGARDRMRYRVHLHNKYQISDKATVGVELQAVRDIGIVTIPADGVYVDPWTADESTSLGFPIEVSSLYYNYKSMSGSMLTFGRFPSNNLLTNGNLRVEGAVAKRKTGSVNWVFSWALNHNAEANAIRPLGLDAVEAGSAIAYGKAGPINYNLQFFNFGKNAKTGDSAPYVVATDFSANMGGLGLQAQFGGGSVNKAGDSAPVSFVGVKASYKMGPLKVAAAFSHAGENGMLTTSTNNSLINNVAMFAKNASAAPKASFIGAKASLKMMSINTNVNFLSGERDSKQYSFTSIGASKKIGGGIKTVATYAMEDDNGVKNNRIRLDFTSKF